MKLDYDSILQQTFKDSFRGYSKEEVQDFLQLVANDFKELNRDIARLKRELKMKEIQIKRLEDEKAVEKSNHSAHLENMRSALKEKAREFVSQARHQADRHKRKVEAEVSHLQEDIRRLREQKKDLTDNLKSTARPSPGSQTRSRPARLGVMTIQLKQCEGGIQFPAAIQPRASRNEILGVYNQALKIKLTSPPVDGAANQACIKFLAKEFGISPSQVYITKGETSRNKTIQFDGMDEDEFLGKLESLISKQK